MPPKRRRVLKKEIDDPERYNFPSELQTFLISEGTLAERKRNFWKGNPGGCPEAVRHRLHRLDNFGKSSSKDWRDHPRYLYSVKDTDHRYTPDSLWQAILPYFGQGFRNKTIWDPFWGDGSTARFLRGQGYTVIGKGGEDFFSTYHECDLIVTNPPFSSQTQVWNRLKFLNRPFVVVALQTVRGSKAHIENFTTELGKDEISWTIAPRVVFRQPPWQEPVSSDHLVWTVEVASWKLGAPPDIVLPRQS